MSRIYNPKNGGLKWSNFRGIHGGAQVRGSGEEAPVW